MAPHQATHRMTSGDAACAPQWPMRTRVAGLATALCAVTAAVVVLAPHALAARADIQLRVQLDGCPGGSGTSALSSSLFAALNFSNPGIAAVSAAHAAGNLTGACNELALYYASSTSVSWLRHAAPKPGTGVVGGATDAVRLNDTYDFYGEVGRVPREPDGGLDWHFYGPVDDDEFMYALNRHGAWSSFLSAWLSTGNPDYAQAFDARVADWAAHNTPAPTHDAGGNTTWRTLEAGIRGAGSWPTSFFGFQQAPQFKASTRCAMVAALAQHGAYLHAFGDAGNSNWLTMQYNGLATVAITLPELLHADDWYSHATTGVLKDMADGVYPDGVENEETAHYHRVALTNFAQFAQQSREGGRAVDPRVSQVVEGMYNYLAYAMDPQGQAPLNGDSDEDADGSFVAEASTAYNRSDWLYIASHGQQGTPPTTPTPSAMFPWAGQLVSRSGWDADAHWSWFDVGPFGSSGHGHRDHLHLSIRIGAQRLIVDSGRFAYNGPLASKFRAPYAVHTRGHNAILVDGCQQVDTPPIAKAAVPNASWALEADQDRAFSTITFDGAVGDVNHTRGLVYVRGKYWVVADRVQSDRSRSLEALWHAHPSCTVKLTPGSSIPSAQTAVVVANNSAATGIVIVQAAAANGAGVVAPGSPPLLGDTAATWANASVIRGQMTPTIQGWYSPQYGAYSPSPAISYTAHAGAGSTSFAWLLVPTKGALATPPTATIVSSTPSAVVVLVQESGVPGVNVTVPMATT